MTKHGRYLDTTSHVMPFRVACRSCIGTSKIWIELVLWNVRRGTNLTGRRGIPQALVKLQCGQTEVCDVRDGLLDEGLALHNHVLPDSGCGCQLTSASRGQKWAQLGQRLTALRFCPLAFVTGVASTILRPTLEPACVKCVFYWHPRCATFEST